MSETTLRISVSELCERQEISRSIVISVVEHEIARPVAGESAEDWLFDVTAAHWVTRAARLQRDLELDWVAVAILVDALREQERLGRENRQLRERLTRFIADD
jgi:chaperone modulatory protein CbpM